MSDAVIESFEHPLSADELRARLIQRARGRFGIQPDQAEDIVQNALTSYLQVRHRYEHVGNPHAILFGIFYKKCLEHIDRGTRERRRLRRYCATPEAARDNPWIRPGTPAESPGVLHEMVRSEESRQILKALDRLSPRSRELVGLMVGSGLGRRDLVETLKLNENTLDSRLHACRRELQRILSRDEISHLRRSRGDERIESPPSG